MLVVDDNVDSAELLSLILPMWGYELAGVLRQDPRTHSVPLVALTGYGQDEDRRRKKGAAHLTKPVDMDTLRALLGGLIPDP